MRHTLAARAHRVASGGLAVHRYFCHRDHRGYREHLAAPSSATSVSSVAAAAFVLGALACPAARAQGSISGGGVMGTTSGGGEIVTNEKITELIKAGFSDELVIRVIQGASRTQFDLNVETGLLELKKANVSEVVIKVMMDIWEKQRKMHDRNIRIFIQMMRTDRQDEYDTAMRQLIAYGAYAVPLLVVNLRDEDERIRAGCAEVLGRIGDPASIDALFQAVIDRNPAVRAKAARALSIFKKETVAPRILAAMKREGQPRDGFALALGYIGDKEFLPNLLDLADDPGPETDRAAAAYALGLLGDPRLDVVKILKGAVLNDTFRELREASSRALGRLAPRMRASQRADVAMALIMAMKRFSVSREVLALQLRHFPSRRSVEALIDQLGNRNKDVAGASWEALRAITGEEFPQEADQWRSWWEVAQIQPRWSQEEDVASTGGPEKAYKPLPLPEVPPLVRFGKGPGKGGDASAAVAPPPGGEDEAFLFSVAPDLTGDLEGSRFTDRFRREFEDRGIPLSPDIAVTPDKEPGLWKISDAGMDRTFLARSTDEALKIYDEAPEVVLPAPTADPAKTTTGGTR